MMKSQATWARLCGEQQAEIERLRAIVAADDEYLCAHKGRDWRKRDGDRKYSAMISAREDAEKEEK